jgi:hypothetical protein
MIAKNKPVRLKGEKLAKLNADIHERDNDCCVLCGRWVDPGEKFHHEPCGPDKQDRVECGVVLCEKCHYERHFGKNSIAVKKFIEEYLKNYYGGDGIA